MSSILRTFSVALALVVGLAGATYASGINEFPGTLASPMRNSILKPVTSYEAAFNADDIPGVLEFFAQDAVMIPGNDIAYEGEDHAGVLGAFGSVIANLEDAGVPLGAWDIAHTLESYGKSGDRLYARLILSVTRRSTGALLDRYNCTFEFKRRDSGNDPSKYVITYVHFSPIAKASPGAGTVPAF
jgi:ketosteroid isomerase-like protein